MAPAEAELVNRAFHKLADYLARRDHSRKELRDKLLRRFDPPVVEQAIDKADQAGWLRSPDELSRLFTEQLNRQLKGHFYIQQKLQQKGLPPQPLDEDIEREKLRLLLDRPDRRRQSQDPEARHKLYQSLVRKGFPSGCVRQLLLDQGSTEA